MKTICAPACHSCHYLSIETRCPIDPDAPDAWQPGDVDKMFEKLVQDPYLSKHNVNVISSPESTDGPWVITMENLIEDDEADRLIELGKEMGFQRSTTARIKADGTPENFLSEYRTSAQTWCWESCSADPIARRVIERLSNLTGVDKRNSEFLQLLEYQPGQEYTAHHGKKSTALSLWKVACYHCCNLG